MTVRDAFCILTEGGKATGELHHVGLDDALGALRKDGCLDLLRNRGALLPTAWANCFAGREAGGVRCRGWDFGNAAQLNPQKTWAGRGRSSFTLSGFTGHDSASLLGKRSKR